MTEVRSQFLLTGSESGRKGKGVLPGSLLSAKATMWIPFKSSSCGRKESKVTLPGEM